MIAAILVIAFLKSAIFYETYARQVKNRIVQIYIVSESR